MEKNQPEFPLNGSFPGRFSIQWKTAQTNRAQLEMLLEAQAMHNQGDHDTLISDLRRLT